MASKKKRHYYVVYNMRLDIIGVHRGPKFMELKNPDEIHYWPHDIDHGGMSSLLCDEDFREDYFYIGEL